jgi:hypothetical protein
MNPTWAKLIALHKGAYLGNGKTVLFPNLIHEEYYFVQFGVSLKFNFVLQTGICK